MVPVLPATYQLPAALILVAAGAVACFLGFRLFRIVLAIFGFILGALAASSFFGEGSTAWMVAAAVAGGLAGAGVLIGASFLGVALVGAGLGAAVAHLLFTMRDAPPHYLGVVFLAIVGAAGAMYLQRYFIIVGTAFSGAWTVVVGGLALAGHEGARTAASSGNVWVVYPLDPGPGQAWIPAAWLALAAAGLWVQLAWTGGSRGRVGKRRRK